MIGRVCQVVRINLNHYMWGTNSDIGQVQTFSSSEFTLFEVPLWGQHGGLHKEPI